MREAPRVYGRIEEVRDTLVATFGTRVSFSMGVRTQHGRGESYHPVKAPDAVVFAESIEDVQSLLRICLARKVPLIPYGAGTSLEGHLQAEYGGVCLDMSRMNHVIAVHAEDQDCECEPGVTLEQLNRHVRDLGLFFPIDPGANATLGGMVATRASGTNAVLYGTMADNVLNLEVAIADGRLIRTGTRATKSAAGYDLTHLFVGSEGTLGIITRLTVRLYGVPASIRAASCVFPTLRDAVSCVAEVVQLGIRIARVELLDEIQVQACNRFLGTAYAEQPSLFFEFHGSEAITEAQFNEVRDVADSHGMTGWQWAASEEARRLLWRARHSALLAAKAMRPGVEVFVTDVCVPISALTDCIVETRNDIDRAGLKAPIVGHVGDGNFHVFFLVDMQDPNQLLLIESLNDALVDRAIRAGGTCTGEHGIGCGKREKLLVELGENAVGVMRDIKRVLDESAILNPGKVFN